ncbi:MAG TPA: TolC family outer membrane protein [Casimicrobiaceae bacterium]|jgi:outer membrane protein|nr:TolC family outer membrane protein [Casimicrobiaceae bacterium]
MKRALVIAFGVAIGAALPSAAAEDLVQIYRDAVANDPTLASARATWEATQEVLPQARANLLPAVTLQGNANRQNFYERLHNTDPGFSFSTKFPQYNYTVSATQPLFRKQNLVAYDQAKQTVSQSDYTLASTQEDLIVRVAQAYFDVLLAQFTIELTDSQKAAVSENLAQAKRNFEVGTATITDTNDAQAKYDQIVAQELSVQNDLDNKIAALRAIIGRQPKELKRFAGSRYEPQLPTPNSLDAWVEMGLRDNLQVRIAQSNFDIAQLEVDRQRAGHYPTLDLVASFNQAYQGASASVSITAPAAFDSRLGVVGVQLNVPLYLGGSIDSRVRQAVSNLEGTRQNLEAARRSAQLSTQTAFTGVTSGFATIKALEQALVSAQVSYDSTKVGLEVGVRTNLDVLNQQQQVYQTRFNLAQAYYNFLLSGLRLKQAVGTLTEADLEQINRSLSG